MKYNTEYQQKYEQNYAVKVCGFITFNIKYMQNCAVEARFPHYDTKVDIVFTQKRDHS